MFSQGAPQKVRPRTAAAHAAAGYFQLPEDLALTCDPTGHPHLTANDWVRLRAVPLADGTVAVESASAVATVSTQLSAGTNYCIATQSQIEAAHHQFFGMALARRAETRVAKDLSCRGFDGFYDFVGSLTDRLGIPETLTDLGVRDPDIDALVASALNDPSTGGNPVTMTPENTKALLLDCL